MANKEVVHVVGALTRHQFVCVACKAALNSVHVRTCMHMYAYYCYVGSKFTIFSPISEYEQAHLVV